MRKSGRGYVYFACTDDVTKVKVGFTVNLYDRMASLSTGNASKLRVIRAFSTDYESEALIHARMSEDRIRGEWFHMSFDVDDLLDDIMDYQMGALGYVGMSPRALESVFIGAEKIRVMLDTLGDHPWPEGFVPYPEKTPDVIALD